MMQALTKDRYVVHSGCKMIGDERLRYSHIHHASQLIDDIKDTYRLQYHAMLVPKLAEEPEDPSPNRLFIEGLALVHCFHLGRRVCLWISVKMTAYRRRTMEYG